MASASGGAAVGGAAAVGGDVEERKIELFTLGLRTDGTHTRMSADAAGDKITIPGDGWCLYSSFIAAFDKYRNIFDSTKKEEDNVDIGGVLAPKVAWRHAISLQFARYLAEIIASNDELYESFANSFILSVITEIDVSGGPPLHSQIQKIYKREDGGEGTATHEYGYKIDIIANDGDYVPNNITALSGKFDSDSTTKHKFINLGTLTEDERTPEKLRPALLEFLLNMWNPQVEKDKYTPRMYGDANLLYPNLTKIYDWLSIDLNYGGGNVENPHIILLKDLSGGAHFDALIFEYVPPEIDLFPEGSSYLADAKAFLSAMTAEDKKRLLDSWIESWNKLARGEGPAAAGAAGPQPNALPSQMMGTSTVVVPPGSAAHVNAGPVVSPPASPLLSASAAEEPTLAEAAAVVADMLDAVATAGTELLGKGGNQPPGAENVGGVGGNQPLVPPGPQPQGGAGGNQPPEPVGPQQPGGAGGNQPPKPVGPQTPGSVGSQLPAQGATNTGGAGGQPQEPNPLLTDPAQGESLDDFMRRFPVPPEWKESTFDVGSLPIPPGNIDKALAETTHTQIKQALAQIRTQLQTPESVDNDTLKLLLKQTIVLKFSLAKIFDILPPESERAITRGTIDGIIMRIQKIIQEKLTPSTGGSASGGAAGSSGLGGGVPPGGPKVPGGGGQSGSSDVPPGGGDGPPGGGGGGLSDADKKDILDRLAKIEAYLHSIHPSIQGVHTIRTEIDNLQAQLAAQQTSIQALQKELADLQKSTTDFSTAQRAAFAALNDQIAALQASGAPPPAPDVLAGLQRQINALNAAVALRVTREQLDSLIKPTAAGGTAIPVETEALIAALTKRLGDLETQLEAPVAAGASSSSPAIPQTDIQQIRVELATLLASVKDKETAINKSIADVIAAADERLGKIEGPPPAGGGEPTPPLNLTAITTQLDTLTTQLTQLTAGAAVSAAKDKETQDALAGIQQQLAELRAVRADVVKQQAVAAARIKMPPSLPTEGAGRPSWFNPVAGQYSARIAEDLSGFQAIIDGGWLENRTRDAQQAKYRDAMGEIQAIKDNKKPLSSSGSGDESFAKELKKKQAAVAAAFPDRTVFIDGKDYTVRNPFATLQQRMDVSGEGFFMRAVPKDGDPLRLNVQVLQAFAPPAAFGEFLADNKRAIAILESLWHCGNQPGADLDPKCFPARVIEELREYNALQEATGASKSLRDALLKGTGMPTVIRYLRRLLELAKPAPLPAADAKPLPAPAASSPAPAGPAPAPPTSGGGSGPAAAPPALKRKPLPILSPGLGSGGRGISVGGRRLPFLPPPAPGLGFIPVIPETAGASSQ